MTPEELEERAAREAVAGLKDRLEKLNLKATTTWEMLAPIGRQSMRGVIADTLANLDTTDTTDPIRRAITEALAMGAKDAARRARVPVPKVTPSSTVMLVALQAPDKAREELAKAALKVREAETADDLQDAFNSARRAVTRTEAAARFAVNRSLSEGVQRVADQAGLSRVWLPERDACVHCLAYAGEVAGPGESFRGGLTFGRKPLVPASEDVHCPLHPNCRCRVQVYDTEQDSPDFPAALKREALRSILRGWSLESESQKVRLDAADRALKAAARMPKSVQDYARNAVKRGAFPRGNVFPSPRVAIKNGKPSSDARGVKAKPAPGGTTTDVLAGLPKKAPLERMEATEARPAPKTGIAVIDQLNAGRMEGGRAAESDEEYAERDRTADTRVVNTRFDLGREWQVNCQRVAAAWELRRRGYDVEALPNPKTAGVKQYTREDLEGVWREPVRWIRPDGSEVAEGTPGALKVGGGIRRMEWVKRPGAPELKARGMAATFTGQYALRNQLVRELVAGWPPGSRGWVVANWKAGGAHIWNVEVDAQGVVHWYDAQPGIKLNADGEPHLSKASEVWVMRVDDLVPTEELPTMVKARPKS